MNKHKYDLLVKSIRRGNLREMTIDAESAQKARELAESKYIDKEHEDIIAVFPYEFKIQD